MGGSMVGRELYRLLEAEVRTPKEPTLLDAFLPAASAIPSVFAEPAPPPPVAPDGASISQIQHGLPAGEMARDRSEDEPSPPKRRRAAKKQPERQKSIEEEIAEFMSRDGNALAPDKDPA